MEAPAPDLESRVEALLKKRSESWRRVERGYTPAQRWVVRFEDGSACFVKAGDDLERPGASQTTAYGLRREHRVYSQLADQDFLPRMLGWSDEPGLTVLILEDLSDAFWPPPWTDERVSAVLETLASVHEASVPGLRKLSDIAPKCCWQVVAVDPSPFLSLGLTTSRWLEEAVSALSAAEAGVVLDGTALLHVDVRSDNICFAGDRAVLIDWNYAACGNAEFDIAVWLPSLQSEGGPPPETFLPQSPEFAAYISGYFAANAGLPPQGSRVREVQLAQLKTALPWAVRALGLPPPDGPNMPPQT